MSNGLVGETLCRSNRGVKEIRGNSIAGVKEIALSDFPKTSTPFYKQVFVNVHG